MSTQPLPPESRALGLLLTLGLSVALITTGLALTLTTAAPLNGTHTTGVLLTITGAALMLRALTVAGRNHP